MPAWCHPREGVTHLGTLACMTERPDEDPTPEFHAFGVPVPPALAGLMQDVHQSMEMADMSRASQRLELYNFLDGLQADQLRILRFILNQGATGVNYIDGMVSSIIRLRFKLDPETGEPINPETLLQPKETGRP